MTKHWQQFEPTILKWGLAILLIAIPLYPKFPVFSVSGTYVAIRFEDFLILILAGLLFLHVVGHFRAFMSDVINQSFILFFLAGLVATLAGIFVTQTVVAHIGLLHWIRRIEYVIPFFVGVAAVKKAQDIRFYLEIMLVVAVVALIYALGQINLGWPVISTQSAEFSKGLALRWIPGARIHSTFAGHYDLAAFLVLVIPLGVGYWFWVKDRLGKMLVLVGVAGAFWLLMLSASRISTAAYFLGVAIVLWLLPKRLWIVPIFAVSILFVFTTSDLLARSRYTLDVVSHQIMRYSPGVLRWFEQKIKPKPVRGAELAVAAPRRIGESTFEPQATPPPEDRSTSIRLNAEWPRAVRAFFKNPLLGTGYSSITLATDNDYLRLLGEIGLLGMLAFLLVVARILLTLYSYSVRTEVFSVGRVFVVGVLAATVGILLNAVFIDVFEASKVALVFWALVGIAVGITRIKHETTA